MTKKCVKFLSMQTVNLDGRIRQHTSTGLEGENIWAINKAIF